MQRKEVSPEDAGFCGCWQFVAIWREQKPLRKGQVIKESEEYSFYVTSAAKGEHSAKELVALARAHWSAIEIGSHYRRDVTLGEDASQISGRTRPYVMATLRNLVLGLYELQKDRGQTKSAYLPNWLKGMTQSHALQLITRRP